LEDTAAERRTTLGGGHELARELPRAFLRIEAAGEWKVVLAEPLDVVGMKCNVRIYPH
jgi:hypothetical protein